MTAYLAPIALLLALFTTTSARAETAAVVSLGGDLRRDAAKFADARRAAREALATYNYAVLPEARLPRELPVSSCEECMEGLRTQLQVDVLISVIVWVESGRADGVEVYAINRDGYHGPIRRQASNDEPFFETAKTAAAQAISEMRDGPVEFTVSIRGEPEGVEILIDGDPVGTTQWSGPLRRGAHELIVRKEGFVAHERTLQVTGTIDLPIRLIAEATEPTPPPPLRYNRPDYLFWLPGALGVASLAPLTVGLIGFLTAPGCSEYEGGTCLRGERTNVPASAVWTGIGIAGLIGAGVWFGLDYAAFITPVPAGQGAMFQLNGRL